MYFTNNRSSGTTSGVINLIVINVIVFIGTNLIAQVREIDLYPDLALWNPWNPDPEMDYFRIWQPVTSMFMHADLMHLLFNMLGLFFFGRMLEQVFGTRRFLTYYMICGIGASLLYLGWAVLSYYRDLNTGGADALSNFAPCVGASGAVFGLMIGAAMLFPNTQFLIYGIIPMRLGWMALLYGTYELVMIIRDSPSDRVAHFAHIGGLIFGLVMILLYQRNRKKFY